MASPSHSSDSSASSATAPQPAPASVVQTVNIKSHVPMMLDMAEPNYTQWRPRALAADPRPRDADWVQNDHSIVNWLYTIMNKPIFDNVYKTRASAFRIWIEVEGIFRDYELHTAPSSRPSPRVGHPVSEPSQVLNLLRGLHAKYRHLKPIITDKSPPHTFQSARSYLLLEELRYEHDTKHDENQTFIARHGGSSATQPQHTDGSPSSTTGNSNNRYKPKNKKQGHGASNSAHSASITRRNSSSS
ncbi:uncharacterized protein LOC105913781 [Setaria italica]|uniref:uncharacterized protein LOC105913781 n=1 Tax=Setaria italica TaxID=4555 RepID=UPI00064792CB|nr:uncharacterized protein LOC105913781 [Setaria italica]